MHSPQAGPTDLDRGAVGAASRLASALFDNLSRVIRGKPEAIRMALVAMLSGGHLLIEDVPGVGKTLLAKAMALSVGGTFHRVQATPDLLPSDVTGVSVFHRGTEEWVFRPGPIFAHVVLVDEVNRATPRTQAALLEAMEEHQVTVDGSTWKLPEPFFLIATQNPFEHAGTFPLPEGQLDRFSVDVHLGYPDRSAEREVVLGRGGADLLAELSPVTDPPGLLHAIHAVRRVHCEPTVAAYVVELAVATRTRPEVALGASPRASLNLLHAAQAHAAIAGRHYVTPDDVKAVAIAVLAHRLVLAGGTDTRAATAVVSAALAALPVPRP
jgi:MoxR-like ATPase